MRGLAAFVGICACVALLSTVDPQIVHRVAAVLFVPALLLVVVAYLCSLEGRR